MIGYCSCCGKQFEEGQEIGVHIRAEEGAVEYKDIIEMFGRSEFEICYCCWIKSLGVKTLKEKNIEDVKESMIQVNMKRLVL